MDDNKIIETLRAVYTSLDSVSVSGQKNMAIILGCMQALQEIAASLSSSDTANDNA